MYNVFLVEDEKNLNDILVFYLENEGYKVKSFVCGLDAEKYVQQEPHLWILDIMLPDMDGYELINRIKKQNQDTPVIFISARDEELDRVIGLQMGSDDYIAKPFLPMELIIRTRNLLTRIYKNKKNSKVTNLLINDTYTIDFNKRMVFKGDEKIDVTSKEFDFLSIIINNKNNALSREDIINKIYGEDYFGSDRTIDDLVRRVRKKLPEMRIETIYGYGYRWCEGED
ncbi:response regulator transcription factor [Tepidibacter hydrothermalis]|uniref:Stage 0 sporulation protein A homolog n=1 Tax=Tepidibacter hydrothermalis TaxID=3036126 RepID=A0ABY8EKV2_9FIRM|nr:response regulator transcription factor [Tepidibacter hydrothermalis]WFD11803.1 response regulator transcription factor [Tepidibacter hydrothermalis]